MVVTQSVTKSVYRKASGLPFKHESFTINGNDGVCAGVRIWKICKPFYE